MKCYIPTSNQGFCKVPLSSLIGITMSAFLVPLASEARDLYQADGVVNDYRFIEVSGFIREYDPAISIIETGTGNELTSYGDFYGVNIHAMLPYLNFYYAEAGFEYAGSAMTEGLSFFHEESASYVENPGFTATAIDAFIGLGVYMEVSPRATLSMGGRVHYSFDEFCMTDFACDTFSGLGGSLVLGGKYWVGHWLRGEANAFAKGTSRSGYPVSDGKGGVKEISETNMMFGAEANLVLMSGNWQLVPGIKTVLSTSSDYVPEYTQISMGLRYSF